MPKVLIILTLVVMLSSQVMAAMETVVFEGLVAFVVEPLDPPDTTNPNLKKEVRAVLVNAHATKTPNPATHIGWLVVQEKWVKGSKSKSMWQTPGEHVWNLTGYHVWELTGYEVTFSVSDQTKIDFNETGVAALESVHAGKGKVKPAVWDDTAAVVGGRVRLRGGELRAGGPRVKKCKFEKTKNKTGCPLAACVPNTGGGLARYLKYVADFDTIKAFPLGSDPDSDLPALEIELNDGAEIQIVNTPFWSMGGESHYREFYDLSIDGTKVGWEDRCNVHDLSEDNPAETPETLLMDKLVFCPPAVLTKR